MLFDTNEEFGWRDGGFCLNGLCQWDGTLVTFLDASDITAGKEDVCSYWCVPPFRKLCVCFDLWVISSCICIRFQPVNSRQKKGPKKKPLNCVCPSGDTSAMKIIFTAAHFARWMSHFGYCLSNRCSFNSVLLVKRFVTVKKCVKKIPFLLVVDVALRLVSLFLAFRHFSFHFSHFVLTLKHLSSPPDSLSRRRHIKEPLGCRELSGSLIFPVPARCVPERKIDVVVSGCPNQSFCTIFPWEHLGAGEMFCRSLRWLYILMKACLYAYLGFL